MFEGIIISQFNKVVKNTIYEYSQKYESQDIQLFLVNMDGKLDIQVLCKYKVKEVIKVSNLKGLAMVSNETVEGKILDSLKGFKSELNNPKIMLLIHNGNVAAYLYDSEKPIRQIEISKLI
jgi:hypothetical protein